MAGLTKRTFWLTLAALLAMTLVLLNVAAFRIREHQGALRAPMAKLSVSALSALSFKGGFLVADSEGRVHLLDGGNTLGADGPRFPGGVAALAVDENRDQIYVADGDGNVALLDSQLKTTATGPFPGQVSGLAVLSGGELAVCYGLTGFGPDYGVAVLQDPSKLGASALLPQCETGFSTRLLASGRNAAYYATLNARVGKVDLAGRQVWHRVLPQRPTALAAMPNGEGDVVVIGDRRGALTVMDSEGNIRQKHQASRFPLTRVGSSPDGTLIFAGDSKGRISLYDAQGNFLLTVPAAPDGKAITAFLCAGSDLLVLSGTGDMERLVLPQPEALQHMAKSLRFQLPGSLLLLVLMATCLIIGNARLSCVLMRFLRRLRDGRVAYLLLAPTFALLLLFCYYPVLTAFLYSFTKLSLSSPMEFVGLANFKAMGDDPYVWVGLRNMFIFLVTGLIKTLTVPLLVAELVFWLAGDRLRQMLRTFFVLPAVVPGLVGVLLWKMIFDPDPNLGLINKILKAMGLPDLIHAWLAEEKLAIWSIVFAGFPWVNIFAFLILLGGLINISRDIYEAGEIDGISVWGRFRRIDIPLIMPQIKLLIVFVFIGSIQDFTSVLVFTGGGPGISTYVPALQMFLQTAEGANLGYAAAIGVFLFALVLGATLINMKLIKTQEH